MIRLPNGQIWSHDLGSCDRCHPIRCHVLYQLGWLQKMDVVIAGCHISVSVAKVGVYSIYSRFLPTCKGRNFGIGTCNTILTICTSDTLVCSYSFYISPCMSIASFTSAMNALSIPSTSPTEFWFFSYIWLPLISGSCHEEYIVQFCVLVAFPVMTDVWNLKERVMCMCNEAGLEPIKSGVGGGRH